ncbi:FtsB family cell division protein [Arsenicibacter rosenii]|uniref:Septum formation initiator n=1 Tax=Arsenicibacter rosenii TaxID=1750698 RepID=A0A1S2VG04_9BACT|nr:septum formation initiator [Arsenicibacter rosenii]OIN57663.1 septum formation initiator [Arsenicibacter rosenii]
MFKRILRSLRNFYVATGVGLFLWMVILDPNDLRSQFRNWWTLHKLQNEEAYYQDKIKEVQKARREVLGTDQLREKYAREKYLMKKPTETVYVIVDEHNEPIEK